MENILPLILLIAVLPVVLFRRKWLSKLHPLLQVLLFLVVCAYFIYAAFTVRETITVPFLIVAVIPLYGIYKVIRTRKENQSAI
jgi:hypothetical protein